MVRHITPQSLHVPLERLFLALPNPSCLTSADFLPDVERPACARDLPPYMPRYLSEAWYDLFRRFCAETGYDPETDPEEDERSAAFFQFMREL